MTQPTSTTGEWTYERARDLAAALHGTGVHYSIVIESKPGVPLVFCPDGSEPDEQLWIYGHIGGEAFGTRPPSGTSSKELPHG